MESNLPPSAYLEYDPLDRPLSLEGLVNNTIVGFGEGLAFGALGRHTGAEYLPAIIPMWDALHYNSNPMKNFIQVREQMRTHKETRVFYTAFSAGVAVAYIDKIYTLIEQMVNKL